jgi:hypothetical protein
MTDDSRHAPSDPFEPVTTSLDESTGPTTPDILRAEGPVTFNGRTPRKAQSLRVGMVAGSALVVVLGSAVAMGASPAPSGAAGATAAPTQPANNAGPGGPGTPFGGPGAPFGGPGAPFGGPGIAPGGPDGPLGRGGPGKGDGRGFGQVSVTAISGSDVSLATEDGWTRTISTTSATTITRGGAVATLADLAVGDDIRFSQTRNADGTWTITAIEIVLPSAAGTVSAVGSDTITITLRDGTSQTISTTGSTTYRLGGTDGDRADVTVGTAILATGEKDASGNLTATTVSIRLPRILGTVTATTADTITLTRRDGTTATVHVASGTAIEVAGVDNATIADVKAGMVIEVGGTQRADGSIDATEIHAGTFRGGRGRDGTKPGDAAPGASAAPDASATPG